MVACKMYKKTIKKAKQEKIEKVEAEYALKLEAAHSVYMKFKAAEKFLVDDYKALIKFIVSEEGGDDAAIPSQYSQINQIQERPNKCKNIGGYIFKSR